MRKPESLQALKTSLEQYYSNMHASIRTVRALYDQQYDYIFAKFGYEVDIHKSATATNIIDGLRNQITTDKPTVNFEPISGSREHQRHANDMKQWARNMLDAQRAVSEIDADLQGGFDLLLSGACAQKLLVDEDARPVPPATSNKKSQAWRQYQDHLGAYNPFINRALDPLTVYPAPGLRHPLAYVLEVQTRRTVDMWDEYPDWTDPKAKGLKPEEASNPGRPVAWLQFWSPEFYIAEGDGERVHDKPNPYGITPYLFEFSGTGHRDITGDPVYLARGVLHPVVGELEAEVRLKTAISVQALMHVFPTLLTTDDAKEIARKFSIGPGRILEYTQGKDKPTWLETPEPNENMYRYLDRIETAISRVANAALYGLREPGVDYGILQAQMVGQALKSIAPIRATMDRILTQKLNMMARMMYVRDLSMSIQATEEKAGRRMLSPEDFKYYHFKGTYETVDPSENDRLIQIGEMMRRAGDLSRRTMWRVFAPHVVTDPDAEEAELGAEKVLDQMAMSGMLTQVVLSEDQQTQMLERQDAIVEQAGEAIQERAGGNGNGAGQVQQSLVQKQEGIAGTPGLMAEPMNTARGAEVASLAR